MDLDSCDEELDSNISSESDSDSGGSDDSDIDRSPTWSNVTHGMKPVSFTKDNKLLVPIPGTKPIDWFNMLIDDIMIEKICKFTNAYALELYCGPNTVEQSRITKWKDLTPDEFKTFLGLLIHTGSIPLNRLQDYWKTHYLYNLPSFRQYMSRDRFLAILRCLYFTKPSPQTVNNQPAPVTRSVDRLNKVNEVVDYFNNKMASIYYPTRELSLDESMLLWRGRLRQYVKGKRHKYGIKIYSVNEPDGLLIKMKVYAGSNDIVSGKGHGEKVVFYLMRNLLNNGHSLFMDNFYNSFSLASKLLAQNTLCTGTLRANRKNNPPLVIGKKLKKGEIIGQYAEGVLIGKWRDKREVLYISTQFENDLVTAITKRGVEVKKPLPIVQYNAHMKGVDRHDQLLSYYPLERKTIRWYKKVFVHVLHMSVLNAYLLFNMNNINMGSSKISLYDFRLQILEALLPTQQNALPSPRAQLAQKRPAEHNMIKNEEKNKKGETKRKACRVCYKAGRNKKSIYVCSGCPDKPALCPVQCFDVYHKTA